MDDISPSWAMNLLCAIDYNDLAAVQNIFSQFDYDAAKSAVTRKPLLSICLIRAVIKNNLDMTRFFIEKGADLTALLQYQNSSISHIAVRYATDDVLQLLLESGINPQAENSTSESALVIAANKGAIQTCKILMSYGACLDSAQQLKVILEHALSHQYDDILEFFIQSPEDFSVIDPSLRSHAAEYLIQKSLEKYWPHLIQYSIESAKIENNNPLFGDMLDFAIEQADADLLHMLIQKLGLGFVFTNVLQHTDSMSAQLNDDNPVIQIVEQKIQPLLLSADPQKIQLLARLKHRFSNHY